MNIFYICLNDQSKNVFAHDLNNKLDYNYTIIEDKSCKTIGSNLNVDRVHIHRYFKRFRDLIIKNMH